MSPTSTVTSCTSKAADVNVYEVEGVGWKDVTAVSCVPPLVSALPGPGAPVGGPSLLTPRGGKEPADTMLLV